MVTFLVALVIFTGILLVVSIPLLLVARRDGRFDTIRKFLVGAGVVGLLCAIGSATSDALVNKCTDAGNSSSACIDAGTTGFQVLLVGGYAVAAWTKTYLIHND